MTEEIPTKKRLTISITNGAVDIMEELRSLLEKRLAQRLSIAEVMKRIAADALDAERAINTNSNNF